MRSVFVHLWHTNEFEVSQYLDRRYARNTPARDEPEWLMCGPIDYPFLWINFYRDGPAESDDWDAEFAARGSRPAVSVAADITGRHDGLLEARTFVVDLLDHFEGVATDDYWDHLWTRPEVAENRRVNGWRFEEHRDER